MAKLIDMIGMLASNYSGECAKNKDCANNNNTKSNHNTQELMQIAREASHGKGSDNITCVSTPHVTFFHHYQGSIDFNTVNIHCTVGMYFLVYTGNKG